LGSIFSWFALFFHVDLHRPSRYTTHLWQQTQHLKPAIMCANQVVSFANYNLIAAIVSFIATIGKIYESKIHYTLSHLFGGGLGLMSVYFITEPTVFTMEWLPSVMLVSL
jgi:maltose/moltooligosaccharide transporter